MKRLVRSFSVFDGYGISLDKVTLLGDMICVDAGKALITDSDLKKLKESGFEYNNLSGRFELDLGKI